MGATYGTGMDRNVVKYALANGNPAIFHVMEPSSGKLIKVFFQKQRLLHQKNDIQIHGNRVKRLEEACIGT